MHFSHDYFLLMDNIMDTLQFSTMTLSYFFSQ